MGVIHPDGTTLSAIARDMAENEADPARCAALAQDVALSDEERANQEEAACKGKKNITPALRDLDNTRRALRRDGFKLELREFDFALSPQLSRR